jgi:nucleotide sugar dehydrogenase
MNDAVIIGNGTVGKATGLALGIKEYMSRKDFNISWGDIKRKKFIFICLPTPTVDGMTQTKDIEDVIGKITAIDVNKPDRNVHIAERPDELQNIFIIRSTVPVGFNKNLQEKFPNYLFVSNPEFLSEDSAFHDAVNPDLIVIGSDSIEARDAVKGIYDARFKGIDMYITDSVTAELIKYALNTFFTTKILFANQIYDFSQKTTANYETVKAVLMKHPWGSKNHFTVYHKGGRGAAGKCLKKDLESFTMQTNSEFFKMMYVLNQQLLDKTGKQ